MDDHRACHQLQAPFEAQRTTRCRAKDEGKLSEYPYMNMMYSTLCTALELALEVHVTNLDVVACGQSAAFAAPI